MNKWEDKITSRIKRKLGINEKDVSQDDLIKDYINDVFIDIMNYTNASSYNLSYDPTLIDCVVALHRRRGVEGAISRSAGGVNEHYSSSNVIAPIIASRLPQILRSTDYRYSKNRFDYPEE